MKTVLKAIDLLEANGYYRLADQFQNHMIRVAAFPYNLTALDELPLSARFYTWDRNEADFEEFDDIFWKELKVRLPDYRTLNTDKSDKLNFEGALHGGDPVPGPAYVDPGNLASSPSMNGSLDYFTWEEVHDSNTGPDYWKNLLPRR